MMTLAHFQAAARDVDNLRDIVRDCSVSDTAIVYPGDAFIERDADGVLRLTLHRDIWTSRDMSREMLEAILYAWDLTECPDGMGIEAGDDVHTFICQLQDWMGLENFARAMLANRADGQHGGACAMQDYCDANEAALIAADGDMEKADAIYSAARPFLRGGAPLAVGDFVRFAQPADAKEAAQRFTVVELRGPRVLVAWNGTGMNITPTSTYAVADLVHA